MKCCPLIKRQRQLWRYYSTTAKKLFLMSIFVEFSSKNIEKFFKDDTFWRQILQHCINKTYFQECTLLFKILQLVRLF